MTENEIIKLLESKILERKYWFKAEGTPKSKWRIKFVDFWLKFKVKNGIELSTEKFCEVWERLKQGGHFK